MRCLLRALAVAAVLAGGVAGAAGAASPPSIEILFETAHFSKVKPGQSVVYTHKRETLNDKLMGPSYVDTARAMIGQTGADGKPVSTFVLDEKTRKRTLDMFEGVPGNPLIMVFMEQVSASVKRATGGGAFYIQNRLKESLAKGEITEIEAQAPGGPYKAKKIVFHPFDQNSNADKLGPFARMTLEMTFASEAPGMILSLTAQAEETPGGKIFYQESYTYAGAEAVK